MGVGKDKNLKIRLTNRQKEVLKYMIKGYSNPQIAKELSISISTVKAHVSAILEKFNVKSRIEAATDAIRKGYCD